MIAKQGRRVHRDRKPPAPRAPVKLRDAPAETEVDAASAAFLRGAKPDAAGTAASLDAADTGTRTRAMVQLQRQRGNAYVQRVVAALRPSGTVRAGTVQTMPAAGRQSAPGPILGVQPMTAPVVQRSPAKPPEFFRDGADKLYAAADPTTAVGVCDNSGCYLTADGGALATLAAGAIGELKLGGVSLPIVPVKKVSLAPASGTVPAGLAGLTGWRKRGSARTVTLAFDGETPRGSVLGASGPLAPGSFPAALRSRLALGSRLSLNDGRFWTLAAGRGAQTRWASQAAVQLRTALDSRVIVQTGGGGYTVRLRLGAGGLAVDIPIAEYRYLSPIDPGKIPSHQLPILIEDFVTATEAKVRMRYNPNVVDVTLLPVGLLDTFRIAAAGVRLDVQATAVTAEQLLVEKAPIRRGSSNVNAPEDVRAHTGRSDTDVILSSLAGAEGGFASVEGVDAGIFTWGQAQWTVGAVKLQPVLQFIKERRADLWDKYWAQNGLDLTADSPPRFTWEGKAYANTKPQQMKLFRTNATRKRKLVAMFAQAGMDPQIQRLQREYMREVDVPDVLENKVQVKGHSPEDWLNVRGKAFFYSMFTNAEGPAIANFKLAVQNQGGGYSGAGDIPAAVKDDVSTELGRLFMKSSVWAKDITKHHYIAFWGTDGKALAVKHAEDQENALAEGKQDNAGWTKADWKKHKKELQARQTRYEKTLADLDAALNRANVEPDVPPGLP